MTDEPTALTERRYNAMPPRRGWILFWFAVLQICRAYGASLCPSANEVAIPVAG
jgi:hypothetical protein